MFPTAHSNIFRCWIDFWQEFSGTLAAKADVERGCPIPDEPCPKCGAQLFLQASKRGLFIGCSAYPACDYTRPLHGGNEDGPTMSGAGSCDSGQDILLLNGRYGWYVQVGATPEDKKIKPRRASWPKTLPTEHADLATALKLLSLPREVGMHPDTQLPIVANIGRFGPYLQHDGKFKSIPKADDVYSIDLARALEVLAMAKEPRGGAPAGKPLGNHPEDGKPVTLHSGQYGWYVKHGKVNATLPKDSDPEACTLNEAIPLLAARVAKGTPTRKKAAAKKPAAKASSAKAATAKATTAKKPAAKKPAAKKPAVKKAVTKAPV